MDDYQMIHSIGFTILGAMVGIIYSLALVQCLDPEKSSKQKLVQLYFLLGIMTGGTVGGVGLGKFVLDSNNSIGYFFIGNGISFLSWTFLMTPHIYRIVVSRLEDKSELL